MSLFETGCGATARQRVMEALRRSARGLASIVAVSIVLLAAAVDPAHAGTKNGLNISITPVPDSVSPSPSTCTTANPPKGCVLDAEQIVVTNISTSNISNAWFKATTYVLDASGAATSFKAPFVNPPSNCTVSTSGTTILCNLGQLPSGGTPVSLLLLVQSPTTTTSGNKISLQWDVPSGQGGVPSLSPVSSQSAQTDAVITLIGDPPTAQHAKTKSYVASNDTVLFTGNTDIATLTNLGTVKSLIPTPPVGSVAALNMDVNGSFCTTSDFPQCIKFLLNIPGTFGTSSGGYLTIILQRDGTTIQNGAKVQNVTILYQEGTFDSSGNFTPTPNVGPTAIVDCNLDGSIPDGQKRCIAERFAYPNNSSKDLKGDFRITIHALENGSMSW